jgi:hypothetical protein
VAQVEGDLHQLHLALVQFLYLAVMLLLVFLQELELLDIALQEVLETNLEVEALLQVMVCLVVVAEALQIQL